MSTPVAHRTQTTVDPRHAALLLKFSNDARLPALGNAVSRVVELTSSDDEALQELATFVLSDVALTQKILRLSNTVSYRTRSIRPITTVTSAIYLLGFDMVKASALAILLVDHMADEDHAQSVRAELTQSMCASVIGQHLARQSQLHNIEEAVIAALFKNLGPLLVAAHDHPLYQEITALSSRANISVTQAATVSLGCSLDQLASMVLQDWGLSDTLIRAIGPLPPQPPRAPRNQQERLALVASFSSDAARLLIGPAAASHRTAVSTLLARFGTALNLERQALEHLVDSAITETHLLLDSVGLGICPPKVEDPPAEEDAADAAEAVSSKALLDDLRLFPDTQTDPLENARYPSGKPLNAQTLLLTGVQEVTQMMSAGHSKLGDLVLHVLETLYQSMGFRFATVCLKDAKTGEYRARITIGEKQATRQVAFRFMTNAPSDIFQLALKNNADLLIEDATAPKIHTLLPSWHRQLLPDTRSFVILPLALRDTPLGLLYADRALPAPEGVSAEETALIKTLKSLLLAAIQPR